MSLTVIVIVRYHNISFHSPDNQEYTIYIMLSAGEVCTLGSSVLEKFEQEGHVSCKCIKGSILTSEK